MLDVSVFFVRWLPDHSYIDETGAHMSADKHL